MKLYVLSLALVHGGTKQHSSTQPFEGDYMAFQSVKTYNGACTPLSHILYFGCYATFLISTTIF